MHNMKTNRIVSPLVLLLLFFHLASPCAVRAESHTVIPYNYVYNVAWTAPFCDTNWHMDHLILYSYGVEGFQILSITNQNPAVWDYSEWTWNDGGWPVTAQASYWRDYCANGSCLFCSGVTCGADLDFPSFPFQYAQGWFWEEDVCDFLLDAFVETLTAFYPTNAATNFVKCSYTITDQTGTAPTLVGTNILTPMGACDTNRDVYWYGYTLPGIDCTPTLPASWSNYTFTVSAQTARLRIYFGTGTNDVTDKTTNVIVGEQIKLTCAFDDGSIAPITNFQWTIAGNIVSNYIPSTPTLLHDSDKVVRTNGATFFHWYVPAAGLVVQCTAIAQGRTMTAKATFNVVAPEYTLTLSPSNTVQAYGWYVRGPIISILATE